MSLGPDSQNSLSHCDLPKLLHRENFKRVTKKGGFDAKVRQNLVCGSEVSLTRVLKNLFGAQKGGSIEPFRGLIEPFGGFDRTFWGGRVPF